MTQNFRAGFITLFAAVSFVLLIACSNVANLCWFGLVDGVARSRLRMAIGASRASVVRLFVFESLLVSLIAGAAGAFVAWRLVPLVPQMASNFLPLEANTATSVSVPVLLFTIGLSILTGLLMGIYPALQGSHADLVDALKEGGRGTAGSVRQQRFRKILVGAQVAYRLLSWRAQRLLITSFVRLTQQNIGFRLAKSLDRCNHVAGVAISGRAVSAAFRRANARRVARCSRSPERDCQRRHPAQWRQSDALRTRRSGCSADRETC